MCVVIYTKNVAQASLTHAIVTSGISRISFVHLIATPITMLRSKPSCLAGEGTFPARNRRHTISIIGATTGKSEIVLCAFKEILPTFDIFTPGNLSGSGIVEQSSLSVYSDSEIPGAEKNVGLILRSVTTNSNKNIHIMCLVWAGTSFTQFPKSLDILDG